MGSEAGETLDQIIQRKEVERLANNGSFAWGIGSSLGDSVEMLKQVTEQATVVFTPMLSKPKYIDEQPSKLLLWLGGRTRSGKRVDLPDYSLLTSRGHTETNDSKKKHYALLCRSNGSITLKSECRLDGASVVNLKTGNPVGSSQVTAVVKRTDQNKGQPRLYDVGFTADLSEHVQIILDHFVVVSAKDIRRVVEAAEAGDVGGWKSEIVSLKEQVKDSTALKQLDGPNQLNMFAY